MFRPALSNLAFGTNAVERMRILANGNIGIGRSDPTFLMDVNGTVRCGAITAPTTTNTINGLIISSGNVSGMGTLSCGVITGPTTTNTINGLIISNGYCTATDFTATSDERTKTDIKTISNALDIVKELRGVYFTRIGQTNQTVGVIAQEVEAVLPEVVHTDSEGLKSVSYGNMIGVLIEAVKTLSERLEKIESVK
jgi:hypothetical protein